MHPFHPTPPPRRPSRADLVLPTLSGLLGTAMVAAGLFVLVAKRDRLGDWSGAGGGDAPIWLIALVLVLGGALLVAGAVRDWRER
ncbi:hypothetical protein [Nocardioides alkalitolerans]|uniref:hypothetical protein n=1 Tax=Nocardioides alkalitolerans TaxID=281714 RepID=UPI0012F855DA|nr:hypothetical protein [Nocardioides alkalitolerans]